MKAADLAHIVGNRPIGPDRLTGERRAEWDEMVRLWTEGKLAHLSLAYLHRWATENCGITIGYEVFRRLVYRDESRQRLKWTVETKGEGQLNAEQDSPQEPAKADRAKGHRTGRRRRPAC